MSKKVLSLFFMAFFLLGYAQYSFAQISLGIHAGALIKTQTFKPLDTDAPEIQYRNAIQFAIPVEISLSKRFALQPEIMFGSHGSFQKISGTGNALGFTSIYTVRRKYNVNAFEIPVLAKLKFDQEYFTFHLLGGPSIGRNTAANFNQIISIRILDSNGVEVTNSYSDDDYLGIFVKDGYDPAKIGDNNFAVRQFNFNLHFGAGAGLRIDNFKIYLDCRYILGLSDFAPEASGVPDSEAVTIRSNRIGLVAGFSFAL